MPQREERPQAVMAVVKGEQRFERWKARLLRIRFLYRSHEGELWGVPRLGQDRTPENVVRKCPLSEREWLARRTREMGDVARSWEREYERHEEAAWMETVLRIVEGVISRAPSEVVRAAFEAVRSARAAHRIPDFEERVPIGWMKLQNRLGRLQWKTLDQLRFQQEFFFWMSQRGIAIPSNGGDWAEVPESDGCDAMTSGQEGSVRGVYDSG